ncbi:iron-sulfur cluster biosynthesis family protein [Secundilactobacillus hailunensis]|uniref:Iron-sulfur cluster biosynthesis family protein n=1 Tax=Secundilactobacillus hailunensis TaxID=2559923 RepID=A0ABW1T809_9LACO|nr:iron-sulfur cluster biosynthesis family protein [Secundilactobacillus hailunensis]
MTTLKMSETVQERLQKHLTDPNDRLILDFDDGVGAYSEVGVCSLDVSFRFLVVDQQKIDTVYDETLDSALGDVHIKGYADNFINKTPELNLSKLGLITLKTDEGLVDSNVEILDHPEIVASAN